ncbi:conserved virulence factor C family protein [Aneurinibacillus sp. Ricciae_BoGa-3]|uniref:conserved virulence factor C family protein n=1 Tax=Aneurinibacillus sp. Ricciae_BoGa-3 TaxID=3022697 RepID=UPI002340DB9C|nr:conserved virulence factor C family protein [Aneurinibacillus sp. Ricciae_BoGa-3]WCK56790.1 conserved virulence factor C family protein [Aneurinibacillus sp. Ricciae_BoGa-3]
MKIKSIEPTPSPNVMKLNMDEALPEGVARNFTREKQENAPDYIQQLLAVNGVQGVFQVGDFISVERHPKADWKEVIAHIEQIFGKKTSHTAGADGSPAASFGEVQVLIQKFKGIPIQIKLVADAEEMRFGLPPRFSEAVMKVQKASQNYILERIWDEQGVRYGTFKEIGEEVGEELAAAYDNERLGQLIAQATEGEAAEEKIEAPLPAQQVSDMMEHPDWEKRFAALDRMNPTVEDIPVLAKALNDPKTSIRRLATVYLGMISKPEVLPHLFMALKDKSAVVRRTAGDALSDIGDPLATGPMADALADPNKLVRWRAARFLFEVGEPSAIPALLKAQHDPEFEVSLQAKMALERIESGEAASGTVWQQISRSMAKPEN